MPRLLYWEQYRGTTYERHVLSCRKWSKAQLLEALGNAGVDGVVGLTKEGLRLLWLGHLDQYRVVGPAVQPVEGGPQPEQGLRAAVTRACRGWSRLRFVEELRAAGFDETFNRVKREALRSLWVEHCVGGAAVAAPLSQRAAQLSQEALALKATAMRQAYDRVNVAAMSPVARQIAATVWLFPLSCCVAPSLPCTPLTHVHFVCSIGVGRPSGRARCIAPHPVRYSTTAPHPVRTSTRIWLASSTTTATTWVVRGGRQRQRTPTPWRSTGTA